MVRGSPGAPECTVLGFGDRVSCLQAAFANGGLAHSLNYSSCAREIGRPYRRGLGSRAPGLGGNAAGRLRQELIAATAVAAEFVSRLAGALAAAGVDANEKFLEGQLLEYFGAAAGAGRVARPTGGPHAQRSRAGADAVSRHAPSVVRRRGGKSDCRRLRERRRDRERSAGRARRRRRVVRGAGRSGRPLRAVLRRKISGVRGRGTRSGERFYALDTVFKPWPTSGILHPFDLRC